MNFGIRGWCTGNRQRLSYIASMTKFWTLFLCLIAFGFGAGLVYEKLQSTVKIDRLITLVEQKIPSAVSKLDEAAEQVKENTGMLEKASQQAKTATSTAKNAATHARSAAKSASTAVKKVEEALTPTAPTPPARVPDWLNTP